MTVIDHQAHWHPGTYLERILDREAYPRARRADGAYVLEFSPYFGRPLPPELIDIEAQFADMDRHGVDVMVSSPVLMGGVDHLDPGEALETIELLNEETAAIQRAHPDRFVGLAMLPMAQPESAVKVLDRAIEHHDLRGVCMLSNVGARPLVTAETMPVFERIEHHDVPLFLHPSMDSMASRLGLNRAVEVGLNWMYDTTAAALSLVFEGVFDAAPRLTVVHPHLGGVLPFVLGRVTEVATFFGAADDVGRLLATHFYTDTVGSTDGTLAMAANAYGGLGRVLFATDYPFVPRDQAFEFVRGELADDASRQLIAEHRIPSLTVGHRRPEEPINVEQ